MGVEIEIKTLCDLCGKRENKIFTTCFDAREFIVDDCWMVTMSDTSMLCLSCYKSYKEAKKKAVEDVNNRFLGKKCITCGR